MHGRPGPMVRQPIRRSQPFTPSPPGCDMTPEALARARDSDPTATAAAVALWKSIVGDAAADPVVPRRVKPEHAGSALNEVISYLGEDKDVLDDTLREVVFRTGSYLQRSGALLGFHGSVGEDTPDADPARGGYSAFRRSGSMALLEPYRSHRAGAI